MGFTLKKTKDKFIIKEIIRFEAKKRLLKSIIKNEFLPVEVRVIARTKLSNFNSYSRISRLVLRCLITNKSRLVQRKYKITKIVLKKHLRSGLISGFKKGK